LGSTLTRAWLTLSERSAPSRTTRSGFGEENFFRVSFFPECQVGYGTRGSNTRRRLASPSDRFLALGEAFDTREISILP
jgi:hypothetical protein